jgi:peptide/nickel transport system permease protein
MLARPPIPALLILAVFLVFTVAAPWIAPFDPSAGSLSAQFVRPFGRDEAGLLHILGTDQFGRDILSRMIYGTRISVSVAVVSIAVAGTVGSLAGMVAGYYGGAVDTVLMRLVDITLSVPLFLIAIVLAAVVGPSTTNVIAAITFLLWPRYARQLRGETLVLVRREFVDYSRVIGVGTPTIMLRHILPNVVPTLIVLMTWQSGYVVLLESSLSFLGAGVPLPSPAWGAMVAEGTKYLTNQWWLAVLPSLAIVALVLSVNMLGDWLRDTMDPILAQA